jgi:probable HAF family extracellular repeat protein
MKRYAVATVALLFLVSPWRQTPTADQTAYTVEALATSVKIDNLLPAETGINASGQVSGTVTDVSGAVSGVPGSTRAVRYVNGTGWEYVPKLTWGSTAAGINAQGDIVGTQMVGTVSHAYRYTSATGVVDDIFPLSGGTSGFGFAINDLGDVVGQSDVGNGVTRGFVAHPGQNQHPQMLPTLGGSQGINDQPCGINNSGQIAGSSMLLTGLPDAVRIEPDGVTIHDAGIVDGTVGESGACAIDEAGTIGGFSTADNFGSFHAFRWSPGNAVIADANLSSAFGNVEAISGGVSVGWYVRVADNAQRALMYTDANGAVDANTLLPDNSGWVLSEVKGINASGQMVGDGFLNNQPAVFRLTPANKKDTTPPVIAAHGDVTAEATGPGGASVAYSAPTTSDDVDGSGTATCTPASGSTFALGTTVVTCSATDAAGNAATATTFKVLVEDTTAPVILAHGDVTAEATGPKGASVPYNAPGTTDAVDGNRTATCAPTSGSTFALGTTIVTCSATDAAGNPAAQTTFKIVVSDTTPPVIAAHSDLTAEATGLSGASVVYSAPATSDAVDGSGTATCTPASGSMFALGATAVTCYAKDAAGNSAAATTFKVIVKDTTPPVISGIYASPDAIWPPNNKMVPVSVLVSATDSVDPSPSCLLTSVGGGASGSAEVTGTLSANVRADNGSVYVLTVTCSDFSGNKSWASTTVAIAKTNGNNGASKANGKSTASGPDYDRDDDGRDRDRDATRDRDDRDDHKNDRRDDHKDDRGDKRG